MTVRLADQPGFRRYWTAATVSAFGTPITTLALQVLVLVDLHASATQLGLVNGARWLPYLTVGLLVGVLLDRVRSRLRVLVLADLGRAVLLAGIAGLQLAGLLSLPVLAAMLVLVGVLSIAADAGTQSTLPRIVDERVLTVAYARIEQSGSVAQASGPLVAGVVVRLVGAPLAFLVDAVTFAVSAALLRTVRTERPRAVVADRTSVLRQVREGMAFVYRHRELGAMAGWTHAWFLANAVLGTVVPAFLVRDLGFGPLTLGLVYACAGLGAVVGGGLANRLGLRFGLGPVVVVTNLLTAVAFVPVALAGEGGTGIAMVAVGELIFGLAIGISSPNELSFRQAVTPEGLQGRMNATIKSFNWGMLTIGAPLGGLLADRIGSVPVIWMGLAGLAATAIGLLLSPFSRVRTLPVRP